MNFGGCSSQNPIDLGVLFLPRPSSTAVLKDRPWVHLPENHQGHSTKRTLHKMHVHTSCPDPWDPRWWGLVGYIVIKSLR